MNNLDKQYTNLLQDIIDNGLAKSDRTGTGTLSVFSREIRHKMSEGFPLLTTKKVPFKTMVIELIWFLNGDTNIQYLVKNGCHIWDGDCYKNYVTEFNKGNVGGLTQLGKRLNEDNKDIILSQDEFIDIIENAEEYGCVEFADKWGDLGPIYGAQWRNWEYEGWDGSSLFKGSIDQIANLINDLKNNPDSRRLIVNAWNVSELHKMKLPPCHYGFQCYTRELTLTERIIISNATSKGKVKMINDLDGFINAGPEIEILLDDENIPKRALSLKWNQRSVDTFLGLPFNIASYGLLLCIIAKEVNMVPDELIGSLGDVHLYLNHIDQAKEQIGYPVSDERVKEILADRYPEIIESYQHAKSRKIEAIEYTKYEDAEKYRNIEREMLDKIKNVTIPNSRYPFELPILKINELVKFKVGEPLPSYNVNDFEIINYKSHSKIKAPLSN